MSLGKAVGDPGKTRLRAGKNKVRATGAEAAILARLHAGKGMCTLEEAVLEARRAGHDALVACEAALALKKRDALVIDRTPPKLPPERLAAQAKNRIGQLEAAMNEFINQMVARRRLAEAYMDLGDHDKAVENLRLVGQDLRARDDAEGAIDVYKDILKLTPMAFFAREQVANLLEGLGKTPEAIAEWMTLARQYADAGLFNRAQNHLGRAVRLDQKNPTLRRYLIELLRALGKKKEAARQHRELAHLYEQEGHGDDALACYQQLVDLDPESEEAQEQLRAAAIARRGAAYFVPAVLLIVAFLIVVSSAYTIHRKCGRSRRSTPRGGPRSRRPSRRSSRRPVRPWTRSAPSSTSTRSRSPPSAIGSGRWRRSRPSGSSAKGCGSRTPAR